MGRIVFCLSLMLFLVGCSTIKDSHSQKIKLMNAVSVDNRSEALKIVNKKLKSTANTGDQVMWQLEAGSLNFIYGNYAQAIFELDIAEKKIIEYDERALISIRDVSSEFSSALLNPNTIPYRGLCRDRIMLPIIRAFSYLALGSEDGFMVEVRRMRNAQNQVAAEYQKQIESEKKAFDQERNKIDGKTSDKGVDSVLNDKNLASYLNETKEIGRTAYGNFLNPFAIFLSGFAFTREGDFENAKVDFKRLYETLPNSNLARNLHYNPKALNQEVVCVIFAHSRSATFREVKLQLFLPYVGYTGVAFPVCHYYNPEFASLKISAGNGTVRTESLANMDAIFAQEYSTRLPGVIARTIISFLVKEGISVAVNQTSYNSGNDAIYLGMLIGTSIYKALFNTADTRSWEILPKDIQVAILPMPKDRKINVSAALFGNEKFVGEFGVNIPEQRGSAIVLVTAPSISTFDIKTFMLSR